MLMMKYNIKQILTSKYNRTTTLQKTQTKNLNKTHVIMMEIVMEIEQELVEKDESTDPLHKESNVSNSTRLMEPKRRRKMVTVKQF